MRRSARFAMLVLFVSALLLPASAINTTNAVSSTAERYQLCGRVFPDPHAYWPAPEQVPERSPYAKGNAECAATDFISFQGMIDGVTYLEELFPQFIEFQKLEEDFGSNIDCATSGSSEDLCSAGLPQQGLSAMREKSDLYMVRVTDESVPDDAKEFFVFPLAIHGIERAGAEAGVRAVEDLATWGACEAGLAPGVVNCAQEGAIPHPMLETDPQNSLTAGDVLQRSSIYFIFPNPDGWRRGDPDNVARFYQRYNGNGVDLNRDWPTKGYTFRPYTPWSEPESRAFGKTLKQIRSKWAGGIDLHGQLIDRAFSFTLMGASQRDYGKNQRILQTVKGAWSDAEARFAWADAYIKPNDAPADDPRMYGVQWGTVWDTIGYQITGGLGDWIDSPLGLGGDGIDNEMSMSHLINCGVGSCYLVDFEQLHIDGNKSLIYSMVNFGLQPEETQFQVSGNVGYVFDPTVIENDGSEDSTPGWVKNAEPQAPILDARLDPNNNWTYAFEVLGPSKKGNQKRYNGGLEGKVTFQNVSGISAGPALTSLVLERFDKTLEVEEDRGCGQLNDRWVEVNRYYNQSEIYLQAGQAVHANEPEAGMWRICLTGGLVSKLAGSGAFADLDIGFSTEQGWANPGQLPYSVTNMQFFEDLKPYISGGLSAVAVDDVLQGSVDLSQFTSLVIADDPFPGYTEPLPTGEAQAGEVHEPPAKAAATAPCAWTEDPSDAPPTCVADYEFDVLEGYNNQQLIVTLDSPNTLANDWDLYIQRQDEQSGAWSTVASAATASGDEQAALKTPPAGHYRARIINWTGTAAPERLEISFSNEYVGPPHEPSQRTEAEKELWAARLQAYVEAGGNLVLTDGALRNLAYMGLVDRSALSSFSVYAGYIGFTADGGETSTYDHPSGLAKDVNQDGSAEGTGHRHQTYEPVPIGYSLEGNFSPVWAVDQTAWEAVGGTTVGTTTPRQATLGELAVGQGRVRIIGALLPMPTEEFYHPFGLSNYALTYTGYQVLNNALQVPEQ